MGLRGWRVFGLAGTIFAYLVGILLLSIITLQNTENRRPRIRSLTERREYAGIAAHPTLTWCKDLRFLDQTPPITNLNFTAGTKFLPFPGHYVNRKWRHLKPGVTAKMTTTTTTTAKAPIIAKSVDYNDIETQLNYEPLWPKTKRKKQEQPAGLGAVAPIQNQQKQSDEEKSLADKKEELTALVSFPGSGNTWLRYLLQQSTGIYTGSIYKDYGLLRSGFPAENIYNSSVLVIKTHEWGSSAWKVHGVMFKKAILLIRDPEQAILAEFNRQSAGHVGYASPDRYTRIEGRYWQQFVVNKLWLWEQTNLSWAEEFPGELKIIFYDDLVNNVEHHLREVLKFLDYPIDETLLACTLLRKEGIYRRRKRVLHFDPYTSTMHERIKQKRDEVYRKLGRL